MKGMIRSGKDVLGRGAEIRLQFQVERDSVLSDIIKLKETIKPDAFEHVGYGTKIENISGG